jgi:plasmid maintenance system antidote protein VapI
MSIAYFLKDRPSISLRGLEKEADLPKKTLSHYVNGRRKLSDEHIEKLKPVLVKYGLNKIELWINM